MRRLNKYDRLARPLDLSWETSITTKSKETKPQPEVSYQLYYFDL